MMRIIVASPRQHPPPCWNAARQPPLTKIVWITIHTGGDPHLGGDDWDAAIVAWLKLRLEVPIPHLCESSSMQVATPT